MGRPLRFSQNRRSMISTRVAPGFSPGSFIACVPKSVVGGKHAASASFLRRV